MATAHVASVDGDIMDPADATISILDEGLVRGDGAFEVLKLYGGHPFRLTAHLDRLEPLRRRDRAPLRPGRPRARDRRAPGRRPAERRLPPGRDHPRRAQDPHRGVATALRREHLRRAGRADPERDPRRRQVDLLRREHAGDPDRRCTRRRRGGLRPPRRDRPRGADFVDLLGHREPASCAPRRSASGSSTRSPATSSSSPSTSRRASSTTPTSPAPMPPSSPRRTARSRRSPPSMGPSSRRWAGPASRRRARR